MNNKQNSNKFLMLRGLFLSAMLVVSILSHAKTEIVVCNTDSLKTKESRDSTIYEDFEFPAEFPGGQEALKEYLKKEFRYTRKSLEKITRDRIILRFTINVDGTLSDIEIVRGSGNKRLDKKAVRVVKNMPRWKPASEAGRIIPIRYYLPIKLD